MSKLKHSEVIAKLHDSEKSMILGPLERQSEALPSRTNGGLPRRAGEEARSQAGPKGRFLASKSFAIASLIKWIIIAGLIATVCTSCSFYSQQPEMTQLQIRQLQTRTFAVADSKRVLKEMINVMQDDAFIVKNANAELGFLTGEKDVDVENGWNKAMSILAGNNNSSWKKNQVIEISANVTQFGKETRVRVNIQKKVFDNFGRVMKVHPIYDSKYYQEFFDKVHKGLFIEQEKI